jgi:predicted CxxxxCH...CXXCH cytochrome family protein
MKYIFAYLSVIILTIYIAGCSELETNINQPGSVTVHQEGIVDTGSVNFHGKLVRENNWNMNVCQQCHDVEYRGGTTGASCFTCHDSPKGPENCSTCHGSSTSPAPPRDLEGKMTKTDRGVGAHQVHLSATKGRFLACTDCHKVPGNLYDQGHIDNPDNRAELIISSFIAGTITNDPSTSNYDPELPLFVPDPSYNSSNQGCANNYCHGNFKNGNTGNVPVWNNPQTGVCGTCHGDPSKPTLNERALPKTSAEGGTHPNNLNCQNCHSGVVNASLNFINPSKHIDGRLNVFGADVIF